jgi:hypothetical protein
MRKLLLAIATWIGMTSFANAQPPCRPLHCAPLEIGLTSTAGVTGGVTGNGG